MYDMYFVGVGKRNLPTIEKLKANILISYADGKSKLNSFMEMRQEDRIGKLMIDSGAFSAHTRGIKIDIDEYISYINENADRADYFIALDHIPGKPHQERTHQDIVESSKISWDNYLYMLEHINRRNRNKILPVFHQGESFEHLKQMLDSGKVHYLCISSDKTLPSHIRNNWHIEVDSILRNYPDIKYHYLGISNPKVAKYFLTTSMDATTCTKQAAYGFIITESGAYAISDRHKVNDRLLYTSNEANKKAIKNYVEARGYKYEDLETDMYERERFNIEELYRMSRQVEARESSKVKRRKLV